jgi:hypothetical protein
VAPTITRQQRHRIIARLGAPSSQPTVSQQRREFRASISPIFDCPEK